MLSHTPSGPSRDRRAWWRGAAGFCASAVVVALLWSTTDAARAEAFVPMPTASIAAMPAASETHMPDAPGYPWSWPVEGGRRVVAPFRAPAHDYGPGHRGMDIAAAPGAEVRAPAAGVVAFRGTVVDRPLLTIDHGDGYVTTWEPLTSPLQSGEVVKAGDIIGTVASGGHAVNGTLHVGARKDGEYVNPRPLFGEVPRAVLLPCCE